MLKGISTAAAKEAAICSDFFSWSNNSNYCLPESYKRQAGSGHFSSSRWFENRKSGPKRSKVVGLMKKKLAGPFFLQVSLHFQPICTQTQQTDLWLGSITSPLQLWTFLVERFSILNFRGTAWRGWGIMKISQADFLAALNYLPASLLSTVI